MKKTVLSLAVIVALMGCDRMCKREGAKGGAEAPAVVPVAPMVAGSGVLARLNDQEITEEEVRKAAGAQIAQAEMALYDVRKEAIDQIIEDRLLEEEATRQGISKSDLLKKNVSDKVTIDDKEIEKFYNENKAQMQGKELSEVKTNIQGYLFRDKHQKVYDDFLSGLKKKSKIAVLITAPKVEIEEGDNPSIGPESAPVKIIEFTDYQCPFCGKARPVVYQILAEYKGKVRYVIRDFPLSFHKDAMKAHEGARCAGEQNKYWEMNKKLFENQRAIKVEDLKKYAQELKLNIDKFNECLDSGKYQKVIEDNATYGEKVGVSGTPAFFINGRMISGARPFPAFKEIIEDELRSAKGN